MWPLKWCMSEVLKCPLTNFYRKEINCSKHVVT